MAVPVRYILAWFFMMVLAVANGAVRDIVYKTHAGDPAAHQISTLILLLLFTALFRLLAKLWPIASGRQAWIIGGVWLAMTLAFEFGLGRLAGKSWSGLAHAYDLSDGQVWIFIPLWVLVGPYVFYKLLQRE